jgi:nicotinamidase-related amidase
MAVDLRQLLSGNALKDNRPPERSGLPLAVLTMELQRGIMGDLASLPHLADACAAGGVVANAARLLEGARRHGVTVVHCTVGHRADGAGTVMNTPLHSALLRRPAHMLIGSPTVELVPELGPAPSDIVSSRVHGVSPFTGTSLDAMLRNLGVRVLVVTGVSVNVAILGLCIEAVNLGYQVAVATDAVAGVPPAYAASVIRTTLAFISTLTTVDEVVGTLDALDP